MTDLLDFSGKAALIVGGSSGIGNAIAQAYRARGASVTVWGTQSSAADYTASDMDGLDYAQVDVTGRAALDAATIPAALDIVVLSQGVVKYGQAEYTREGWDEVMNVNITSLMDVARLVHPALAAREGSSLITISSVAAYAAAAMNPAYGASKSGAVALTRALATAWARDGIRVNGIAPGFVRTKMTAMQFSDEKREQGILRMIPLRRTGETDEIATAALFLASPMSTYMIGQTLTVDGGLSLM